MDALQMARSIARKVLPPSVKNSQTVVKLKSRMLPHDRIYDADFFAYEAETSLSGAATIADSIVSEFRPRSVVDVGCGVGAVLEALRNRGCEVFGLEYAEAALASCRERHLDVAKFDLERDVFNQERAFDVAISTEVAEHLPERVANRYLDLLTHLSRIVVFTAAPPGQGGYDHVNEQPPGYWIAKFSQRGFRHEEDLSQRWRETWRTSGVVAGWYYGNLMIFQKAPEA